MTQGSIIFTKHALQRMRERCVKPKDVERMIGKPFKTGVLEDDPRRRYSTGPCLAGKRMDWLTAIHRADEEGGILVVTTYQGRPTAANRFRSSEE